MEMKTPESLNEVFNRSKSWWVAELLISPVAGTICGKTKLTLDTIQLVYYQIGS